MTNQSAFAEKLVELARSDAPITAFITNLGKYNEGDLMGEWLPLPTTTEQVQACLKRIGLDGIRYEEYFITDYETPVNGLYDHLPEFANLDELNYLAAKLDEMEPSEMEKYEAAVEYGEHTGSLQDLIKAIDTLQQAQQRTEQLYMDSEDKPIEFKTLEGKKKKPEKPGPSRDDGR